ncbi:macrolide export protein-like protein [Tanacetum coccineum]
MTTLVLPAIKANNTGPLYVRTHILLLQIGKLCCCDTSTPVGAKPNGYIGEDDQGSEIRPGQENLVERISLEILSLNFKFCIYYTEMLLKKLMVFGSTIHVYKNIDDDQDSVDELDAALSELKSDPHYPQGLKHMSSATLGQARYFILEHLLRTLQMRDAHLKSVLESTIEMDLDELHKTKTNYLDVYLDKKRQLAVLHVSSIETSADVLAKAVTQRNSNELLDCFLQEKENCSSFKQEGAKVTCQAVGGGWDMKYHTKFVPDANPNVAIVVKKSRKMKSKFLLWHDYYTFKEAGKFVIVCVDTYVLSTDLLSYMRGYAMERQNGLLIGEKPNYLQSKILQALFFGSSEPLGKIGMWFVEDLRHKDNSEKALECLNDMVTNALRHMEYCLKYMSDLLSTQPHLDWLGLDWAKPETRPKLKTLAFSK